MGLILAECLLAMPVVAHLEHATCTFVRLISITGLLWSEVLLRLTSRTAATCCRIVLELQDTTLAIQQLLLVIHAL